MQSHVDASTASRTLEYIVAKGEFANNEQFMLLPQRFQLYSIIVPSTVDILNNDYFPITLLRCF